jgi:hypothetical protein
MATPERPAPQYLVVCEPDGATAERLLADGWRRLPTGPIATFTKNTRATAEEVRARVAELVPVGPRYVSQVVGRDSVGGAPV